MSRTRTLPRIVVVGMGGTIAGSSASSTDTTGYTAGTTSVDDLLAGIPELATLAQLSREQFAQIDSSDLSDEILLALAQRLNRLLAQDDVDGVVITHGTDTLEETAYFLHLVLESEKPVVVVGSMRPATALSADGPMNMFAAVAVAASESARGHGVLVVLNDEIHTARDVTKSSSLRVDSFGSPYGPLGTVTDGRPSFYRAVTRPHTVATEFDVSSLRALPRAAIVYAHTGLDAAFYDTIASGSYEVIINAGFGNGNVSRRVLDAMRAARSAGALIVRATRTGSGRVTLNGAVDDSANGWVAVDDQNPQRARLLASLALTITRDPAEIGRMFRRY